jgi:hypothetical protein
MKDNKKQSKIYTCKYCKKTSENIGIIQTELNYYSFNLNTNQWKDFHGDGSVKSQKFFCLNCNKKYRIQEF